MVELPGFEPKLGESKSPVLPLHYSSINQIFIIQEKKKITKIQIDIYFILN